MKTITSATAALSFATTAALAFGAAVLGNSQVAQQNTTIKTTDQDSPKAPGAKGDVAGQVPAQHRSAMSAPTPASSYSHVTPLDARTGFWATGQKSKLPQSSLYQNPLGALGIINKDGPVATEGHPFFTPLGTNGRACVSCHQPADGMSISVATLQRRWKETAGKDPVFAQVDGANCPNLPPGQASSHSLLLEHGLFRIFLPWPPRSADGSQLNPEFTIQVVRDPTGCNTNPKYGLTSSNPMISIFRRPRVVANMKYPMASFGLWSPKTGEVLPVDPASGERLNLNILADNRQPTLQAQAVDAALTHEQAVTKPSPQTLATLTAFEMQIFSAQSLSTPGGNLTETPIHAGPQALIDGKTAVLGSHVGDFPELNGLRTTSALGAPKWDRNTPPGKFRTTRSGQEKETPEQMAFRDSVARGYEMFMERDILIRNVSNYNTIGLGNPYKQPCANCHNMQETGMDSSPGFMDLGTVNLPTADHQPWLPLFKVTCKPTATPHPYLGRVVYTHDPGRALITGKCVDIGSINIQQFRGLAARAPYFSNGTAKTIRDIVLFYNKRFAMGYNKRDIDDMTNFLSTL